MIDFRELWGVYDWLVLLLYFVGVLSVGFIMHKKATTSFKSFYVASRRLTIPVLVGVAAAAWYDSWTIVGIAECGWKMGIAIIFIYIVPSTVLRLPLALWIGPMTRDSVPDWVVTLPDLVRFFYNKPAGLLASLVPMASILYCCALIFAVGDVMHLVSGINMWVAMVIAGIVIIIYTSMAGLWGLAVTDLIQFAIMTVSAGFLMFGIMDYFGSIDVMFAEVAKRDPNLIKPLGNETFLSICAWLLGTAGIYVNAQSYQRFGAAKKGGDIKVAYTLMLAIGMIFMVAMAFAGMSASVIYPQAESISQGFWATVFSVLSPGARGLFVAALIAAVMSTVSADILFTAGILMKDIVKDCFRPELNDRQVLKGSQAFCAILGVLIIAGTYLWKDGIGEAYKVIAGFQAAVFFVPILGGFFYKRKTAVGGVTAIITGILVYGIWRFALGQPYKIPAAVISWAIVAVVYFAVCRATYKVPAPGAKESRNANAQGGTQS